MKKKSLSRIKYTEKYISYLLAYSYSSPFNIKKNLMVPNVKWGMGLFYEADLVVITKAGYATEIEIKTSLADLKKDKEKEFNHDSNLFKYLYFCFPKKILTKGLEHVPERAGILLVDGKRISKYRPAVVNKAATKLSEKLRYKLCRLGLLRYWSIMHKQHKNYKGW